MLSKCSRLLVVSAIILAGVAYAQEGDARIDLTAPDAMVRGKTQVEIMDTRLVSPQIQASWPWTGPVQVVRNHLPIHWRDSTIPGGMPNELSVGGLFDEPRAHPGPQFPGISQTPWAPPDPTLAVGPNHIVETVNMVIAFYTKAGQLQFSQNLDSTGSPGFFETVGAGTFTFDPKCFYDHLADRFVVVALEVYGSTQSWIDIAVSDDSDPNGVWYKYRTNSVISVGSNTYWVDYPGFGYDDKAFYVTGNLFGLNNGGWAGVLFRVFDKLPLLVGGTADYANLRDGNAGSVQVAQHFGSPQAGYCVSVDSNTSLRIHAVRDPVGTPSLKSTTVTVPYLDGPYSGAPNLGGGTLDTLDGRIINVQWRDGRLCAGHGIGSSSKNVARWYEMNTNNWPTSGSVTLVQSGNIDGGSGVHTWFPAIYKNKHGDTAVVVAASSSSQYASVRVTGRKAGDPAGTMGTLKTLKTGSAGYSGRWGDFFDVAVDPNNDTMFWVIGEYAYSGGWRTWISSFFITLIAGDMNCDGSVNGTDISGFVLALSDPTAYQSAYPNCDINAADVNEDGSINGGDIYGFVNLLNGN